MGDLLLASEVGDMFADALVRLRQSLVHLPATIRREFGLDREGEGWIYDHHQRALAEMVERLNGVTAAPAHE